jgi:glutathione synthase
MNFVFLANALNTFDFSSDTTFILMLESANRGYRVFFLPDGGLFLKDGKVFFRVVSVIPQLVEEQMFIEKGHMILSEDEVDAVWIRTNPPFDAAYLMNTWLLDRLPKRIPIINSPQGIRTVNEKIWATQFASIIPRTLVTRHLEDFLDFLGEEKEIILKPTDGHGGEAVFRLQEGGTNQNVIFETLSHSGKKEVILQAYLPEADVGDKRILLLNGEPLEALLRVHAPMDHRNNLDAGGHTEAAEITAEDEKIIEVLKPELQKLGLYFVGIDVIGGRLIEVNVTSPTCLQAMNRLYGEKLETEVIDFTESLIEKYK